MCVCTRVRVHTHIVSPGSASDREEPPAVAPLHSWGEWQDSSERFSALVQITAARPQDET